MSPKSHSCWRRARIQIKAFLAVNHVHFDAAYLFHRTVHNLLLKAHLYPNHERSGAADSGQKALGDHRDVRVCPTKGVEQSSCSMNTLRQGTGTQNRECVSLASLPIHWLRAPYFQKLLAMFLCYVKKKKKSSLEAMLIIELVATCC